MGFLAFLLFVLALATIPLPPVAILFLVLGISAVIKATKGDNKDGTFSERVGKEFDKSSHRLLVLFAFVGLIILLIFLSTRY